MKNNVTACAEYDTVILHIFSTQCKRCGMRSHQSAQWRLRILSIRQAQELCAAHGRALPSSYTSAVEARACKELENEDLSQAEQYGMKTQSESTDIPNEFLIMVNIILGVTNPSRTKMLKKRLRNGKQNEVSLNHQSRQWPRKIQVQSLSMSSKFKQ